MEDAEYMQRARTPPRLPILSPRMWGFHEDSSSGMKTPPVGRVGSVPFKWEEAPGKAKKISLGEEHMLDFNDEWPVASPEPIFGDRSRSSSSEDDAKVFRFCGLMHRRGRNSSKPSKTQDAAPEVSRFGQDAVSNNKFARRLQSCISFKTRYAQAKKSSSKVLAMVWKRLRSAVHPTKSRN